MVSILLGIFLAFFVPVIKETTNMLQKAIIVLIATDDLGGVIANFTKLINNFHASSHKLRLFFYSLHILQPLIIFITFKTSISFFIFSWLYPVLAALLVTEVIKDDYKSTFASVFWLIGIVVCIYIINPPVIVLWFAITFLTKLILGYSINHFPETN
ncbi:MAG: hypothetical protein FH762_19960 [Firmicutes bacterium]|nr:hypothetical protein [Bacillota bacterium]